MRGAFIAALFWARRRAIAERRRGRSARFVVLTALSGVLLAIGLALVGGLALALWAVGLWPLSFALLAMVAFLYFPWTLARLIAVPLGRPRLAFHIGAEGREHEGDQIGCGLLLAAWALNRQREPSADDAVWIEQKRDRAGRLGDCGVAVTALLAAARGDRDGARALMESIALLPEITVPARDVAADWLAADDAERGQWRRLLDRAPRRAHAQLGVDGESLGLPRHVAAVQRAPTFAEPVWPATPASFFLEGVAARLLGDPDAPRDLELLARWLEAPRRRHTWGLYRRATAAALDAPAAPTSVAEPAEVATVADADPVAAAVSAHVAALDAHTRAALGAPHVRAAACAWDHALGSFATRTTVLARAIDIGAPDDAGHRVLDELARTAADDLASLILAAELPVAGFAAGSRTLDAALQRARHRLLGELEIAITRTSDRVRGRRALPAIDEWRELLALWSAHRRAVAIGGDELRRLAFPHLHAELVSWLIWLWNDRAEHALSDSLTCWLLAEALAVGDAQAIETHAKNASMLLPARA